jgi:hypothetical protein
MDITLKVKAEDWGRFLKLKAEKSSLEKEIKALENSFGFPEAEKVAADKTFLIVSGNGDVCGKFTVYWFSGAEIPEGWRKRIS